MGAIVVLIVIGITVSWLVAEEFSNIALLKGYGERKYFWYCFWLSIVGYLMVIALPARNNSADNKCLSEDNIDNMQAKVKNHLRQKMAGNFPVCDFSEESGLKQCPKCGTCHDSTIATCPSCGYKYIEMV